MKGENEHDTKKAWKRDIKEHEKERKSNTLIIISIIMCLFVASSCLERQIPWPDNTQVRCNYTGPVVNLTAHSLKEIPSNISAQTVCLLLAKNFITGIGQQLSILHHLQLLNLSSNNIRTIHKLAFQNSTYLKVLVLSYNYLFFVM